MATATSELSRTLGFSFTFLSRVEALSKVGPLLSSNLAHMMMKDEKLELLAEDIHETSKETPALLEQ